MTETTKTVLTTDELMQYATDVVASRIEEAGDVFLPGTTLTIGNILPPDYQDECYQKNIKTFQLELHVANRVIDELYEKGYEAKTIESEKLYPDPGWHYGDESCWHKHTCVGIRISKPIESD